MPLMPVLIVEGARLYMLVAICESDALQVRQEIPGSDQGASDKDFGWS